METYTNKVAQLAQLGWVEMDDVKAETLKDGGHVHMTEFYHTLHHYVGYVVHTVNSKHWISDIYNFEGAKNEFSKVKAMVNAYAVSKC